MKKIDVISESNSASDYYNEISVGSEIKTVRLAQILKEIVDTMNELIEVVDKLSPEKEDVSKDKTRKADE